MVVMYGGAPDLGPWQQPRQFPVMPLPLAPPANEEPKRLRVQVIADADGTVRLKVHLGDRLVVETGGRGTLNVETDV